VCTIAPSLASDDPAITAIVDRDRIALDEYIVLKLSVEGTREEPAPVEVPNFTIRSRGSSSQISIVNGAMSAKIEYTYLLYPQKTGVFTIGPFSLKHRGRSIRSNTISVTVTQTEQQPAQGAEIFVTALIDNDHPFLHQHIVCTFQFWRSVQVANANLTDQPSFEGFVSEDLGKPVEYQKVVNGRSYTVTEIKKALFPVTAGVLEITPFTLQCDVVVSKGGRRRGLLQDPFFNDPFFGFTETAPKTLRTAPIQVTVRSLPLDGRPADFKNLVGTYSLSASLSKPSVAVGESTTLTLTLSGTGNIKNLPGIEMPPVDNLKMYDDKPSFEQKTIHGKIGGTLTVKKALVPLAAGNIRIPPVVLHYFDPDEGTYKQMATEPLQLTVAPAAAEQTAVVAAPRPAASVKQDIAVLGRDIMPIHTAPEALRRPAFRLRAMSAAILFCLPIALFAVLLLARRLRAASPDDARATRARKAFDAFKTELRALKPNPRQDASQFYQRASKTFRDFIGDKLGIPGAAMTARELHSVLREAGADDTVAAEASRLLESFDTAIFGSVSHDPAAMKQAYASLERMGRLLDRTLKKPRRREAAP